MTTLDGFFSGPNGEINWHMVNEEFNTYSIELINTVDTILFGRVTYELMAAYWPTSAAAADNPLVADNLNCMAKLVVSQKLNHPKWNNSRVIRGDLVSEISLLKQQPGKDIVIYGSGTIVRTLASANLIDDFRLFVCPIMLGKGISLFSRMSKSLHLHLHDTKTLSNGVVLLHYLLPTVGNSAV